MATTNSGILSVNRNHSNSRRPKSFFARLFSRKKTQIKEYPLYDKFIDLYKKELSLDSPLDVEDKLNLYLRIIYSQYKGKFTKVLKVSDSALKQFIEDLIKRTIDTYKIFKSPDEIAKRENHLVNFHGELVNNNFFIIPEGTTICFLTSINRILYMSELDRLKILNTISDPNLFKQYYETPNSLNTITYFENSITFYPGQLCANMNLSFTPGNDYVAGTFKIEMGKTITHEFVVEQKKQVKFPGLDKETSKILLSEFIENMPNTNGNILFLTSCRSCQATDMTSDSSIIAFKKVYISEHFHRILNKFIEFDMDISNYNLHSLKFATEFRLEKIKNNTNLTNFNKYIEVSKKIANFTNKKRKSQKKLSESNKLIFLNRSLSPRQHTKILKKSEYEKQLSNLSKSNKILSQYEYYNILFDKLSIAHIMFSLATAKEKLQLTFTRLFKISKEFYSYSDLLNFCIFCYCYKYDNINNEQKVYNFLSIENFDKALMYIRRFFSHIIYENEVKRHQKLISEGIKNPTDKIELNYDINLDGKDFIDLDDKLISFYTGLVVGNLILNITITISNNGDFTSDRLNNLINFFSSNLNHITSIKCLNCSITYIPKNILRLDRLNDLDFSGNPITLLSNADTNKTVKTGNELTLDDIKSNTQLKILLINYIPDNIFEKAPSQKESASQNNTSVTTSVNNFEEGIILNELQA